MSDEKKPTEEIIAKVVLSDITGTISSVECSDREMAYFVENGPVLIDEERLSKPSKEAIKRIKAQYNVSTGQEVVTAIMNEVNAGNLIPDQTGPISEVIARGYTFGRLPRAQIYPDVPVAFGNWKKNEAGVYTFSNGSADLQRAILKRSDQGNLSRLVSGYFDTMMVGSKKVPDSYLRVQDMLNIDTGRMLFLSDSEKELVAADKAGCKARLVERPGNKPVANEAYGRVTDLTTIVLKSA